MLDRILKLMADNRITATALSKELGASPSIVQDWKKGKSKPTVNQVILLSKFFNVTTDYILLGTLSDSQHNILNAFNNNNHSTITITNGETKTRQLTEIEAEIIKIASNLNTRARTKLLSYAYELDTDEDNKNEE